MSYEVAKQFLVKISTDAEAAAKADDAYVQALRALAAEYGYKVTISDLKLAMGDLASADQMSTRG